MPHNVVATERTLHLGDLDDKFGFVNGDVFQDWVSQWARQAWPQCLIASDSEYGHPVWTYLDDRRVLIHVINLMTAHLHDSTRNAIRVISTVHNPVRLCLDDEVPPETYRRVLAELDQHDLTVSRDYVWALCDTMFPARGSAWLDLHEALTLEYALMEDLRPGPHTSQREAAPMLTDHLHAQLCDDGAQLLSELLNTRGPGDRALGITYSELTALAQVAHLCTRPCR